MATLIGGVVAISAASGAASGAAPSSEPVPTPLIGKVAVVKWIEGVPTAWPVTATILEPGVTFADGSTSVDVTTDPTGEPLELSLVGVPAGGARVRLQEPDRSDATFQDVVCESSGSWYDTQPIDRGVELIVPPLADQSGVQPWGHWRPFPICWFENVPATRVTLASRLDDGAPAAGTAMVVQPEAGRVGTGGVFHDDGVFPIGADPLPVELSGFPTGDPMNVFIGQATVTGTTIYGMHCAVGQAQFSGPLEARTLGDQTLVGITVPIAPKDDVSCTVDAANADLRAAKTASIDAAGPGAVFDYTIVATNAGRAPLFLAAMTDPVPADLTVVDVRADEASTSCTTTGNRVDCDLGDLAAGAVRTVRITVSVHPDVVDASAITNVAIVRGEVPLWVPGLGSTDPAAGGAVAGVVPTVDRPPVFARAVQVLATSVVRAFAPPPASTTPPTSTTTATPTTTTVADPAPTTSPAAPSTSPTVAPSVAATALPTVVSVAQQGPLPTVTGGSTLPTTGNDLSLLGYAGWTTLAGLVLVVIRRTRRTALR